MRLVRVLSQRQVFYGIFAGSDIELLRGEPFERLERKFVSVTANKVTFLPPVAPSKVVAVGLNYLDHARELSMELPTEPILFLKPPSSVIGPGAAIVYPASSREVHHEAELAVVIGKRARNVAVGRAFEHVLGYTCANDVTARDLQRRDGQWGRAKSFDTFCPLGPYIETELEPDSLAIKARVNGQTRQDSSTAQMIFPVAKLISFISEVMTLEPGDVILTGTPPGVGEVHVGDDVEVEIGGIGVLRNSVKSGS